MSGPIFTIDCKGCGRAGTTPRLTDLWTVEYCPDCRAPAPEQTGAGDEFAFTNLSRNDKPTEPKRTGDKP